MLTHGTVGSLFLYYIKCVSAVLSARFSRQGRPERCRCEMSLKGRLLGQCAVAFVLVVIMLFSVFCLSSCTSENSDIPEMSGQADIGTHDHSKDASDAPVTDSKSDTDAPVTDPPVTDTPVTDAPVTDTPEPQTPSQNDGRISFPVGKGNPAVFDNCLFIGDSRTIGLSQYGDLGNADVFATRGMNVFRVFKETVDVPGHGAVTLEGLLSGSKYSKVYIMLGINEIGYNTDSVLKTYSNAVSRIRELCPGAKIVICANLHIVYTRSASDSVYNNTILNSLNAGMKALANGGDIVYVDVNPLFDDANGALRPDITVDDFHLMGQYYAVWSAWLSENS